MKSTDDRTFRCRLLLGFAINLYMAACFWGTVGGWTGVGWESTTAPAWWVIVYLAVWCAILPGSAWVSYFFASKWKS